MYDFFTYLPVFIRNNNPIKYIKNRTIWRKFLNKPPVEVNFYSNIKDADIEIYIVAFNNSELIENQIIYLNKNCLDKYKLIIADNSSDTWASQQIKQLCKDNKVDYIKLPKNVGLELSRSHWYSLNYLMKNFILKSKVPNFGLLDHDCFLIKKVSFVERINKYWMWGAIPQDHYIKIFNKKINGMWNRRFIRPWCCFFKKELFKKWYDFTPNKRLIPLSFLDTWWGNRKYIYKNESHVYKTLLRRIRVWEYELLWDYFFHIEGAGHYKRCKIKDALSYLNEY